MSSDGLVDQVRDLARRGTPEDVAAIGKIFEHAQLWPLLAFTIEMALMEALDPSPALPSLLAMLRGDKPFISVIRLLGRIGDPEAVEPLIALIEPKSSGCERDWAVAEALGNFKDPRAVSVLAEALYSTGLNLPVRAATALGKIGSPEAIEALHRVCNTGGRCTSNYDRCDGEQDVVWVAKLALRELGLAKRQ